MTDDEADTLTASALTAYGHVRTVAAMSEKDRIALMALWGKMLGHLPYQVADAALQSHVATSPFMPTVSDLLEAAKKLTDGETPAGIVAWGDVCKLMRRGFSTHKAPTAADVGDPVAFEAIQAIGGWRIVCMASEDDPAPRARFAEAYDDLAAKRRRHEVISALPGVRAVLELRGDGARQAALPAATDAVDRRGARDHSLPVRAGGLTDLLAAAAGAEIDR